MLRFNQKERTMLEEELTRVPNRTYLWVYLLFDQIENGLLLTPGNIRSEVRNIPRTVDEAYERILSKSRNACLAKRLLYIVIVVVRLLTL